MSVHKKSVIIAILVSAAALSCAALFIRSRRTSGEKPNKNFARMQDRMAKKFNDTPIRGKSAKKTWPIPTEDLLLYDFEISDNVWEIPEWAVEKEDHVASSFERSTEYAKSGTHSLKVNAEFPGKIWTVALIEAEQYFDWGGYKSIACSIYLPESAPKGLKARLILTVGENWKFTEMSRSVYLEPGAWTTVAANLLPGSADWKMTTVDDAFRRDVRKIAIRVESNKRPAYFGPFYVDEVKLFVSK